MSKNNNSLPYPFSNSMQSSSLLDLLPCPLCNSVQSSSLLDLPCGNLDGSFLYDPIKIRCCSFCGHVYNELSILDYDNLKQHYYTDYPMFDLQTPNTSGDRPGGCSESSHRRYSELYDFIMPCIDLDSVILDIGCARAGFLKFLKDRGYRNLYGVDCSDAYINEARKIQDIDVRVGTAECTNMERNSIDFVVTDQVLEHTANINSVFEEVRNKLKKNGMFCVSVPNAQAYSDCYVSDFYWFAMREHIQHFDREHLLWVAQKNGFYLKYEKTNFPTFFPNCMMLFAKDKPYAGCEMGDTDCFSLEQHIRDYIILCNKGLEIRRERIKSLLNTPFYIWGIGQEFLLLYKNTDLSKCKILGLIDDTPAKQNRTVNGTPICSVNEILKNPEASVMITVSSYTKPMCDRLRSLGFHGTFIEF